MITKTLTTARLWIARQIVFDEVFSSLLAPFHHLPNTLLQLDKFLPCLRNFGVKMFNLVIRRLVFEIRFQAVIKRRRIA